MVEKSKIGCSDEEYQIYAKCIANGLIILENIQFQNKKIKNWMNKFKKFLLGQKFKNRMIGRRVTRVRWKILKIGRFDEK